MAAQVSMDGFEIRIKDQILEMRTEGMRTASMGRDPERVFESLTRSAPVKAVLFDVREAHYVLDATKWEERARVVARMCRDFTCAFIIRPDQTEQVEVLTALHRGYGAVSAHFRSRSQARVWLKERISEMAG